jgi:hypothetical protein
MFFLGGTGVSPVQQSVGPSGWEKEDGMTIQKLTAISLMISLLIFPVKAFAGNINFKPGTEPDSFRGIKFGSNLSALNDMELVETEEDEPRSIYKRKGDKLEIGIAKLESIEYSFWQGKLETVIIKTLPQSRRIFVEICKVKFGEGSFSTKSQTTGTIYWAGKQVNAYLNLNDNTKVYELAIYSKKLLDERESWFKQKAKEGAKEF